MTELLLAFDLEKNYSKDEILELYMNTIYFGDGYYSIYDASIGYFEKLPKEMTLYESTLLAGIPNAPSIYAPTRNFDLSTQRQKQVVEAMLKYEYLFEEDYMILINEINSKTSFK